MTGKAGLTSEEHKPRPIRVEASTASFCSTSLGLLLLIIQTTTADNIELVGIWI
jgi:hypothetical protein